MPRQGGMRGADDSRKWGLGMERHPSVRQGVTGDQSVRSRLQWLSM